MEAKWYDVDSHMRGCPGEAVLGQQSAFLGESLEKRLKKLSVFRLSFL